MRWCWWHRHKNEWLDVNKSAALCTALVKFNQFNAHELLSGEQNSFQQIKLKSLQTNSKQCHIEYYITVILFNLH